MSDARYPAARAVAPRIRAHFAAHLAQSGLPAVVAKARVPKAAAIEAVIDAAFWASLRREEGYVPRISLALLSPEEATHPLCFEQPLPLEAGSLVRVAPAVERPGIHLGVWPTGGELRVWGTTWLVPAYCFVLEVAAPGLLVVKHHRDGSGKFVNVAVLEGDQVKIIDERASQAPDCPVLLTWLLGFEAKRGGDISSDILVRLAVSMRAHGRGGALLLVPAGTERWRESIIHPVSYAVRPPFAELSSLVRETRDDPDSRQWQDALAEAIHAIAGLTAVDGATVVNDRYELLAFGAKIARRHGAQSIERVKVTEPIEGGAAALVHPTALGGTRHLSAAQFVQDQLGAVALVASQDGRFTIFAWSTQETVVRAHRVEALLL